MWVNSAPISPKWKISIAVLTVFHQASAHLDILKWQNVSLAAELFSVSHRQE